VENIIPRFWRPITTIFFRVPVYEESRRRGSSRPAGTASKGNSHANEQQKPQQGQQPQPPWPVVCGRSVLSLHASQDYEGGEMDWQDHHGGTRAYHRTCRLLNGGTNSAPQPAFEHRPVSAERLSAAQRDLLCGLSWRSGAIC